MHKSNIKIRKIDNNSSERLQEEYPREYNQGSEEYYRMNQHNENNPYAFTNQLSGKKRAEGLDQSNSFAYGFKSDVYSPQNQSQTQQEWSSSSMKNVGSFKIGKPSELRRPSYDQNQQQMSSSKQSSSRNLQKVAKINKPQGVTASAGDTTFQSAIQILKRNMDKQQEVLLLEKQLRREDDQEDFEPIIKALNEAAIEYLQIQEKQKALQIINFTYETCVIEQVSIEVQLETMLNYCLITKKNKEFNNSIQMINKYINLSQEHPLLVNLGAVYVLHSQILIQQNKVREALEMAKKGLFQSEQKYKQVMKQYDINDKEDKQQQQQLNQLLLQIASNQYQLAQCEILVQNKKAAIILLQSAISKVSSIQGSSHPTTLKYQERYNQIQQNTKGKEERTFSGYQNESGSSSSSFHKNYNQLQTPTVTFNVDINDEFNTILNKNSGAINHHYQQYNEGEDIRSHNQQQQRPIHNYLNGSNGFNQNLRVHSQQSHPQSSRSIKGNQMFLNRKSLTKNITNDHSANIKLILKQEQINESKPLMFQDFTSTATLRVKQNNNYMGNKQNGSDFYFDNTDSQTSDKIRFLQDTVQSMQQENERLKRQNGYLQIKLRDNENFNSKISQSNKQITNLTTQVEELQKKVKEYKEKNDKCDREHVGEIDKLSNTIRERSDVLRRVLEKNQNEITTYEERITKMKVEEEKKQREVNDQICTLELNNSKNQLQINTLKNEIKMMQDDHAIILQSKEKEIKSLNAQIQQREAYYTGEIEKYQKNNTEVSQHLAQIKQLEFQLKQFKEEKELTDQALTRQRNQLSELTAEATQLQDKFSQANTEIKGRDVTISQLQEQIQKLLQLQTQAANASKLQEQLDKQKKDHDSTIIRVSDENKRLQVLLDEAQKEILEKDRLLESQKNNKKDDSKEKQLKEENDLLSAKVNQFGQKNEDLVIQLEKVIQENELNKQRIEQLNQEMKLKDDKMQDYESNFNLLAMNNKTIVSFKQSELDLDFNRKNQSEVIEEDDDDDDSDTQDKKNENMDNSIGDIQKSLEINTKKTILILQQYDKKFNALFDFQFNCATHKLMIERKGEQVLSISINQDLLQLFYTSKNFFIFSKILRRFASNFLSYSKGVYAEEFVYDVDDITFKFINLEIKFDPSYLRHTIKQLPNQVQQSFAQYSFFSNEVSDLKLIEISQKQLEESAMQQESKKTISLGEGMVLCDQTKENVPIKFIYDIKKQTLKIEPANPSIQGMKIPMKKEDTQQWIVQNKILSLDKQIRAIKMEYVRFLKSSIKRYHLYNRVFSTNISLTQHDQKVHGILTIFKGTQNSFVYIKTLHKEKNFKKFYQVSLNEQSFEKLKEISKSYIIDQCQFTYTKGIQWIRNDSTMMIYPTFENVIYSGLLRMTAEEISAIRSLKGLKDENIIRDENNENNDDFIQIVVRKIENKLLVQPLWDLPIKPLKQIINETETEEELQQISILLVSQVKIVYDQQNGQFYMLQGSKQDQSAHDKWTPTNIFKLDCLNNHLRRSSFNLNTAHLLLIEVIEVPDHTAKSTCKLQIIFNTKTKEYLVRSFLKQVHELKIPGHNLSKDKLLNLYYFYFEQMTIKYLRKATLQNVVYQMRKFKMINKLKFYQIKTETGQYGDLLLFQGLKSTMVILKIMYTSQKDVVRKLFVIQKTNLEQILENINEIVKLINQQIVNIYVVLSYRQIENQDFQFFHVAALWDQQNKEILLKADDLSIPPVAFKKPKLSYKQALFQGEEMLQQAILFKDPQTGQNNIDI